MEEFAGQGEQEGAESRQGLGDSEIEAMIQARAEAKLAKNFAQADQIRATLKSAGVELDDKLGGLTQWRRA
jgi:cysteinyl-tRNA synthetase